MDTSGAPTSRIMVGIDGSDNGAAALRWALKEAAVTGVPVEAVCIYEDPVLAHPAPGYVPASQEQVHEYARWSIDRALEGMADCAGVDVTLRTGRGFPSELLLHEAADPDITTVVIGAHGRNILTDLLSGSVAHALSRQCPKPLVIVPPSWSAAADDVAEHRIVVGFDGSADSQAALAWAVDEGLRRSATVQAVLARAKLSTALPGHPSFGAMGSTGAEGKLHQWLSQRMEAFESGGAALDVRILEGRAGEVLADEADGALMLVVGRRCRTVLHQLTTGSVSQRCVRHVKVPLCIVPGPS